MKLNQKTVGIVVYALALGATIGGIVVGNVAVAVVAGLVMVGAIFAVSEALKQEVVV